ncbi:MAG: F0F1 ATP synthase subunit epsilon [Patescibacteria group bacterium]
MYLTVTSLKGIEYEGEIKSLNIKTTSGEITILDHHRPLVTVLEKGTAYIVDSKENKKTLEIKSGFLEVSPENKVNVLID